MARIPAFNSFLCCLKLETGGIILGWLSAIFSAIGSLYIFICFAIDYQEFKKLDKNANENAEHYIGIYVLLINWSCFVLPNIMRLSKAFFIICAIYIIFLCLLCFASIQLIQGTKQVKKIVDHSIDFEM